MYESIYRQAITKAWYLVWHNKILWIFGLLSVFVGQFGLGDFIGKLLYWNDSNTHPFYLFSHVVNFCSWMPSTIPGKLLMIWIALLALLVVSFVIFVSVSAQGALVAGAADWYKTGKTDKLVVAWHKGVKYFWRVLSINILSKFILGILLVILSILVPVFNFGGLWQLLLLGAVFALVILAAFAISAITVYAIGYVVADNKNIFSAIGRGWGLFKDHLLVSIELSVLLFLAGWLLLIIAFFGSFIVFLPSAGLWLIGASFGSATFMWLSLAIGMILLVAMFAVSGALFNAFTTSAWIYCFMKMKHTGIASRLVAGVERLLN